MENLTLDYFFSPPQDIPTSLSLSLYGRTHLIWLAIIIVASIGISLFYRNMNTHQRKQFKKGMAIFIILFELLRQLIYINLGRYELGLLPLHLCGLTEFAIFIYAFSSNKTIKESLYALGIIGALMALLFADWLIYPIMHFQSLHSFIQHGALFTFCLMLLISGELKPDYRRLPAVAGLLTIICFGLYFFNKVYDTNFFFLNYPSPGSPLVLFEELAGNPGYIALTILLLLVVWLVMYLPFYRPNKPRVREAYSMPTRK